MTFYYNLSDVFPQTNCVCLGFGEEENRDKVSFTLQHIKGVIVNMIYDYLHWPWSSELVSVKLFFPSFHTLLFGRQSLSTVHIEDVEIYVSPLLVRRVYLINLEHFFMGDLSLLPCLLIYSMVGTVLNKNHQVFWSLTEKQ